MKDRLTIDDVIFYIEDYVGGNIEGVEEVDRMGFTVFLRSQLSTLAQDCNKELIEMGRNQVISEVKEILTKMKGK